MAIVTGAHFKGLTFGDVDSRDFGVYITGAGVFNAPSRDVEMVEIPGRNGAYALDKGRFGNIEVTYPAGLFGIDEADFADAISDFRNALASKKGYQRLMDEYNPTEYRMAVFAAGLQVTPSRLKAGEFDITFNCRPQRYLTSGETAVTITSGDTIENPTLFDASPLLMVDGYGSINLGEDVIDIEQRVIGDVLLANAQKTTSTRSTCRAVRTFNIAPLATNDGINNTGAVNESTGQLEGKPDVFTIRAKNVITTALTDITYVSGSFEQGSNYSVARENNGLSITLNRFPGDLIKGESATRTFTYTFNVTPVGQTVKTVIITITMVYDGANAFSLTSQVSGTLFSVYGASIAENSIRTGEYVGYSTISTLGNPMYIDLDIGEAYKYESGSPVSVNSAVSIGATLPVLSPGETEVTFDNTITSLEIVPRWWKV